MNKNNYYRLIFLLLIVFFVCLLLLSHKEQSVSYTNDDLYIIRGIILDEIELTPEHLKKYDLDGNGTITSIEYVRIKNLLSGIDIKKQ